MSTDQHEFAHINIFTPKPGMMEAFIQTQIEGLPGLGDVPGLKGSRLYRASDDKAAIQLAFFESEEAHARFRASPAFLQHRDKLLPLLEGTSPGYYQLVRAVDRD
ncbi:MAG TPA: antibiotic biosynthesis monooxygenase family protein [Burkholderiaceae bacterium]|jgi:heme-degrading monooxygenase HmoA